MRLAIGAELTQAACAWVSTALMFLHISQADMAIGAQAHVVVSSVIGAALPLVVLLPFCTEPQTTQ